ncbi:protein dimerization, putative [Ricinus communis]|uniref:Protein dimerization, putative n=1 Tax=Ricinus communis TaxID=3988 RepID=B9RIN3_RICCO|nr:protein dimerization, putative [Ricinus communis]
MLIDVFLLSVVREKDVCWEYAEKLDGNKVKCKFCLRVLNGGISRLKHHLSRLPSKGVNPCSKVRDDVTDRVRAIIASKEDIKEPSSAKKQRPAEAKSPAHIYATKALVNVESVAPAAKVYPTVTSISPPSLSNQENAERSIALFFFENKLDFSVARSPSYQLMIEAIEKCGPGFTGPSAEILKTTWLERIKSEVSLQLKDTEKEWTTTGCTIIADTWTDNKSRALINFFVSSPSRTFFHKSVDASSYFKNTKCLADLFDSVIQDFGAENVVQIIMDSSFNYTGVANHILQNYGTIFVSPCASQCLNLILEDFSKVDWVNRCISQAQTLSKFIYNNSSMLDLMKKFTGGQELIKTGITKSVSSFLSLQSMLKQRPRLKLMFSSNEYSANSSYSSKPQSIACITIVEDGDFWRAVEECVAITEPFLKVLREVSGGKPAVGSIYELMTRAKESIRTYYIMDESKCKTFLDIVDRKWRDQLHSPLHSAAAFLNPCVQYNPEIKFLVNIKEDFFKVIEKLLPTPDMRRDITNQIFIFTRASGMFGCNLAMEARDTVAPGLWWEQYGDSAPVLQRVAIRILSQVCSTFTFERHWNTFRQIHSEKRNKIDKETLNDLVYINYNLKLMRQMRTKSSETDPIQFDDIDMTSEWVEETDNPSPTQWLDRFGSALDGSDLNTRQFNAAIFGASDPLFGL